MESNLDRARFNMVEQQIRPWEVLDQRILDVIGATARDRYVPAAYRNLAYSDTRIPLGHGQVMMNPNLEGRLLQALDTDPRDVALEIGTGSGYVTACLAQLVARVDSVEIVAELAEAARAKLAEFSNVTVHQGDASAGWGEPASYDAILVTGSVPEVPARMREGLKVGGRLCVIVGDPRAPVMEARLITRDGELEWSEESLFETHIAPLINADSAPRFKF